MRAVPYEFSEDPLFMINRDADPLAIEEEPELEPMTEHDEPDHAPMMQRFGDVLRGAKEDFHDSTSKMRNVAIGVGTLAVQGLDRARTSVVLVPTVAIDVLKHTNSPTEAALAAGATFAAWCVAVGGTTVEGLNQYPKAVESFEKGFPGVVGFFEDVLPGFEAPTAEQREASVARRVGRRALTGLQRGLTVTGIGSVAYASTAVAKGRSRKDSHMLNLNASADGGAVVGGFVYGVGETIVQIANDHPMLAERIQNDAGNIKLWYGVAAAMMAQQYVSKKVTTWREKRAGKQSENAEVTEALDSQE